MIIYLFILFILIIFKIKCKLDILYNKAHHIVDTGITEMKKLNPTINEKVDQFIVRLIKVKEIIN